MNVNFPRIVTAGQEFMLLTRFEVACPSCGLGAVKVTVLDGNTGQVLSEVTSTGTSGIFNHVTARSQTGSWPLNVRVSVVNVPTWGAVGRGFTIYANPKPCQYIQPVGNYTEPPCHGG